MLEKTRAKIGAGWAAAKRLGVMMAVWAVIFSFATIARLAVAFDYDDTLVLSTPAFEKAQAEASQAAGPRFWTIVNQSYDLEKPKVVGCAAAWLFRLFGFNVTVIASRPETGAEALKKEWRRLVPRSRFLFAGDRGSKHRFFENGNFLLFFGDGDADMADARRAKVYPIRILRSPQSAFKGDYSPGTMGEFVLPLSQY